MKTEKELLCTILLVEDDENFGQTLTNILEAKDFSVIWVTDGKQALQKVSSMHDINIILLDIMLPVMDGFRFAEKILENEIKIPIIFITAKTMQNDILKGFKLGADDYLTKPFTSEELIARINAVLKRTYKAETDIISLGKYQFHHKRRILMYENKEIKLTHRENQLLKLLCKYANQILDRKIILEIIWGEYNYFNSRTLDVFISRLRKYLSNDTHIELLSIHRVGFKFIIPEENSSFFSGFL